MIYSDLHCDTMYRCFTEDLSPEDEQLQVTVSALRSYAPCVQTFAHYIPETVDDKYDYLLRMLENTCRLLDGCKDVMLYTKPSDIDEAAAQGKVLAVLSAEGADVFADNSDQISERVRRLERAHIKFLSLCYNHGGRCCDGALCVKDSGFTPLGRRVAVQLNAHGIAADVSHLGHRSTMDLLQTDLTVAATHSNCFSICAHPRNLRDEAISLLIEKNGLMGLNLYAPFLSADRAATAADVKAHLDRILSLGGARIAALGGDLDGCEHLPQGIAGVRDIKKLDIPFDLFYNNLKRFLFMLG